MAYTPIGWQTGDTITAEKMNKMDNGWGFSNTQLFSETVTTEEFDGLYLAELSYTGAIDYDSITVTFNGTDYVCNRNVEGNYSIYGDVGPDGPDFTDYPFVLESGGGTNTIYTESIGTYTMSASADAIEVSDNFSGAVAIASPLFQITLEKTTWQQAYDAMASGKIAYYVIEVDGSVEQYIATNATYNTDTEQYEIYAVSAAASDTIFAFSSDGKLHRN